MAKGESPVNSGTYTKGLLNQSDTHGAKNNNPNTGAGNYDTQKVRLDVARREQEYGAATLVEGGANETLGSNVPKLGVRQSFAERYLPNIKSALEAGGKKLGLDYSHKDVERIDDVVERARTADQTSDEAYVRSVRFMRGGNPDKANTSVTSRENARYLSHLHGDMERDLGNKTQRDGYTAESKKLLGSEGSWDNVPSGSVKPGDRMSPDKYNGLKVKAMRDEQNRTYERRLENATKENNYNEKGGIAGILNRIFKREEQDYKAKQLRLDRKKAEYEKGIGGYGVATPKEVEAHNSAVGKAGLGGYTIGDAIGPEKKAELEKAARESRLSDNLIDVSEPGGEDYQKDWEAEADLQRAHRVEEYAKRKLVAEQGSAPKEGYVEDRLIHSRDIGGTVLPKSAFGKVHPSDYTNVGEESKEGLAFLTSEEGPSKSTTYHNLGVGKIERTIPDSGTTGQDKEMEGYESGEAIPNDRLPAVVGGSGDAREMQKAAAAHARRKYAEYLITEARKGGEETPSGGKFEKGEYEGRPMMPGGTTIPRGAFGKQPPSDYTHISEDAAAGLKDFPTRGFLDEEYKPTEEEHIPAEEECNSEEDIGISSQLSGSYMDRVKQARNAWSGYQKDLEKGLRSVTEDSKDGQYQAELELTLRKKHGLSEGDVRSNEALDTFYTAANEEVGHTGKLSNATARSINYFEDSLIGPYKGKRSFEDMLPELRFSGAEYHKEEGGVDKKFHSHEWGDQYPRWSESYSELNAESKDVAKNLINRHYDTLATLKRENAESVANWRDRGDAKLSRELGRFDQKVTDLRGNIARYEKTLRDEGSNSVIEGLKRADERALEQMYDQADRRIGDLRADIDRYEAKMGAGVGARDYYGQALNLAETELGLLLERVESETEDSRQDDSGRGTNTNEAPAAA